MPSSFAHLLDVISRYVNYLPAETVMGKRAITGVWGYDWELLRPEFTPSGFRAWMRPLRASVKQASVKWWRSCAAPAR